MPEQITLTAKEYREFLKTKKLPNQKAKTNKYGATKKEYNGRWYDSTGEADYSETLDWRKQAGEIKRIAYQYKLPLESNGKHITNYFIDFRLVMSDGSIELHEFKGKETDLWRKKWELAKAQLEEIEPGAKLVLVKKVKGSFEVVEEYKSENK